jgi:hypothetical protein
VRVSEPGSSQIEFETAVVPKSCTKAARLIAVMASSVNPSTRAASAARLAQRGDDRPVPNTHV